MFYVLDQRLKAQKVPPDRAQKVLNEIAAMMLNQRFLEEIFKPQPLYHKQELYLLFRDIAHASIMKLNELSMGKLYDLMVMVFKYQLYFISQPRDLLLITLNHLDSLRSLISSPSVDKQLDSTYYLLMKVYYPMTESELQRIRYDLLNYFQDIHIKVSIFLRLGQQNNDGTFVTPIRERVPNGTEIPGMIKAFNRDGSIKDVKNFPPGGEYIEVTKKGCLDLKGKRAISLGTSIYQEKCTMQDFSWNHEDDLESKITKSEHYHGVYSSEIQTLMTQLLGEKAQEKEEEPICIDLFPNSPNKCGENSKTESLGLEPVMLNDTTDRQNTILEAAASEINIDIQRSCSNDLLNLLENIE
ncbi:protein OSCP1 isoform X2 [Planococcus citri]